MSAAVDTMLPSALAVSYQGLSTSVCPACRGRSSNMRWCGVAVVPLVARVIMESLSSILSGLRSLSASSCGNGVPVTSSSTMPSSL